MDAHKAEFKRLVETMGWSQTETARKLAKSPSAINHLLNPDHPNRPTETTLRLLKLIIAQERPGFFEAGALELKDTNSSAPQPPKVTDKESEMIQRMRSLPPDEQERIYAVVETMLSSVPKASRHGRKLEITPGGGKVKKIDL
jgi:hypothetical protein